MKKAYLDCVKKRLQFAIGEENFLVNLEGKEIEFGKLRTKLGFFQIRFSWTYDNPQFSITEDANHTGELTKGDLNYMLSSWDFYEVKINNGSKEDYTGLSFPQGIQSYLTTYGIMMREVDGLTNYNSFNQKVSSTGVLEHLQKWALEFEGSTIGREWEGTYEDEVVEYLINKIKKVVK